MLEYRYKPQELIQYFYARIQAAIELEIQGEKKWDKKINRELIHKAVRDNRHKATANKRAEASKRAEGSKRVTARKVNRKVKMKIREVRSKEIRMSIRESSDRGCEIN